MRKPRHGKDVILDARSEWRLLRVTINVSIGEKSVLEGNKHCH